MRPRNRQDFLMQHISAGFLRNIMPYLRQNTENRIKYECTTIKLYKKNIKIYKYKKTTGIIEKKDQKLKRVCKDTKL